MRASGPCQKQQQVLDPGIERDPLVRRLVLLQHGIENIGSILVSVKV